MTTGRPPVPFRSLVMFSGRGPELRAPTAQVPARPVAVSTSVTRVSHREDSRGVSSGTDRIGSGRPWMAATRRSMVTYCSTSGPPASKTRPAAFWPGQHPEQVAHDVVDGDRLGAGCDPSRRDHGGQVLDELACQLPG